jgi:hypothetical protein
MRVQITLLLNVDDDANLGKIKREVKSAAHRAAAVDRVGHPMLNPVVRPSIVSCAVEGSA